MERDTIAEDRSTSRRDMSLEGKFLLSIEKDYAAMIKEENDPSLDSAEDNANCGA